MKPLDQTGYWNRAGPGKAFTHPLNVARVTALLPLQSRILDYGCGYGRVLGEVSQLGYWNLAGVDSASAMIAAARAKVPEIAFHELKNPAAASLRRQFVRRGAAVCRADLRPAR